MTPLEAIVKATASPKRAEHEGGVLWSDGHILAKADFEGKDLPSCVVDVWERNASRKWEVAAELGVCVRSVSGGNASIYRELTGGAIRTWINEAYRQALQSDGVTCFVTGGSSEAITFRDAAGLLMAVAMPVRDGGVGDPTQPTQAEVWASFACPANGFYMQDKAALLESIREELEDVERSMNEARTELEDLAADAAELQSSIDALVAQIAAEATAAELASKP